MNITEAINFLYTKIASALSTTLINKTVQTPQAVFDAMGGIHAAGHFHANFNPIDGLSHFVQCINETPNSTSIINFVSETTQDTLSCYTNASIGTAATELSTYVLENTESSLTDNAIALGVMSAAAVGGATLLWYLHHARKKDANTLETTQPDKSPSVALKLSQ